jgi:hypothetical protein
VPNHNPSRFPLLPRRRQPPKDQPPKELTGLAMRQLLMEHPDPKTGLKTGLHLLRPLLRLQPLRNRNSPNRLMQPQNLSAKEAIVPKG